MLSDSIPPELGFHSGTFKRQITHGRIKYLGSTKGAVTSDNVVARRNISADEVCSESSGIGVASCFPFLGVVGTLAGPGDPLKAPQTNQTAKCIYWDQSVFHPLRFADGCTGRRKTCNVCYPPK